MKHSILFLAALSASSTVGDATPQAPAAREPYSPLALASLSSGGAQGNSWSGAPALSEDGRFVAFHSHSDNLVAGDTNTHWDVFVRDRLTGSTERVSVGSTGLQGDSGSVFPSISADGRRVAFESFASNLVPGDTGGKDVFVHDRVSGETVLVSRNSAGQQADGKSESAAISGDGRFVAFESYATNLAPGTSGLVKQVYVHDLWSGTTSLVSVQEQGQPADKNCSAVSISGDGRRVAFFSSATNLVADDTNGKADVFVRDVIAGTTSRVSVDHLGAQSSQHSYNPAISSDGRFVAFQSAAALVPGDDDGGFFDIYVHDLDTGETLGITTEDPTFLLDSGHSSISEPSISADGLRIVFQSTVVQYPLFRPSQVYLHDRSSGVTTLLSEGLGEGMGEDDSLGAAISADGRIVGFESRAANLITGDTNAAADVFVHASGGP